MNALPSLPCGAKANGLGLFGITWMRTCGEQKAIYIRMYECICVKRKSQKSKKESISAEYISYVGIYIYEWEGRERKNFFFFCGGNDPLLEKRVKEEGWRRPEGHLSISAGVKWALRMRCIALVKAALSLTRSPPLLPRSSHSSDACSREMLSANYIRWLNGNVELGLHFQWLISLLKMKKKENI